MHELIARGPTSDGMDTAGPRTQNICMSEEVPHRVGISPSKVLDITIILVPFLGGLTLVIVAIAYETFYDVFMVKPAEVGFDPVGALNRAYATMLGYSALFGIVITLGAAAWRYLRRKRSEAPGGSPIRLPVAAAYSVWLFAFLSQLTAPEFDEARVQAFVNYGLGHSLTLWLADWRVTLPTFFTIVAASVILLVRKRYFRTTALIMTALNLLFALVILMASAYKTGLYTAWALLEAGPTFGTASGPAVHWFSVPTPCVDAVWIGSEPEPAPLPLQNVVYMGDADGTVLLLDGATTFITRLPLNQLVLQEKPPTDCRGIYTQTAPADEGNAAP